MTISLYNMLCYFESLGTSCKFNMKGGANMAKSNYWVSPNPNGWSAKPEGAKRVAKIFGTQKQAEDYARNVLQNNRGGELITQSLHGPIRSKDTINSYDPRSIKDKEH